MFSKTIKVAFSLDRHLTKIWESRMIRQYYHYFRNISTKKFYMLAIVKRMLREYKIELCSFFLSSNSQRNQFAATKSFSLFSYFSNFLHRLSPSWRVSKLLLSLFTFSNVCHLFSHFYPGCAFTNTVIIVGVSWLAKHTVLFLVAVFLPGRFLRSKSS